jgi:hypothetical protein
VALPVLNASLVVAGVTCDVLERAACRNVAACLADHDGEFVLIVKVVADLRLHQRLLMSDLAASKARKQRRLFGDGPADLGNVIAVVESDADDLAGIRNDRSERNLVERIVGMRGCHEPRRVG